MGSTISRTKASHFCRCFTGLDPEIGTKAMARPGQPSESSKTPSRFGETEVSLGIDQLYAHSGREIASPKPNPN